LSTDFTDLYRLVFFSTQITQIVRIYADFFINACSSLSTNIFKICVICVLKKVKVDIFLLSIATKVVLLGKIRLWTRLIRSDIVLTYYNGCSFVFWEDFWFKLFVSWELFLKFIPKVRPVTFFIFCVIL
jgi:hypothetical protein